MKKILIVIATFILSLTSVNLPVMATNGFTSFGATEANILKKCAEENDKGKGAGIICVLNFVIDILTVGVGALGVIGISVVGIQYLTAGGSEEKTRKAKRRMFEIMIGLAGYAVIYGILHFLLPNYA